jgi:hypothetical protein
VTDRGISSLIFQGVLAENDQAKMMAPQMSNEIPTTGKSPQLKALATMPQGPPEAKAETVLLYPLQASVD